MKDAAHLSVELGAFADTIDDLVAISRRTDPARRSELTKIRRRLSDQIGSMREIGLRAFNDPALADEFRARLSTVLNVVAMHQANWPAVSIDEGEAAYRSSAGTAAAGNRAFIEWARAALARDR